MAKLAEELDVGLRSFDLIGSFRAFPAGPRAMPGAAVLSVLSGHYALLSPSSGATKNWPRWLKGLFSQNRLLSLT